MRYETILPVEPMAAPRHRARRIGKGIAFYHLKEYTSWLDECRALYSGPFFSGPVAVEATFYLPRPASVKREYPSVKPDIDNYVKALLDGITGPAFKDDGVVVDVIARKRYAPGAPCIEVAVWSLIEEAPQP